MEREGREMPQNWPDRKQCGRLDAGWGRELGSAGRVWNMPQFGMSCGQAEQRQVQQ